MKPCVTILAALLALWPLSLAAEEPEPSAAADAAPAETDMFGLFTVPGQFSATVTYASRYISRGFDVNEGKATPQLYAEYDHPDGYYAGFFATRETYFGVRAEMDFLAGYRDTWDKLSYDIGYYYYYFPNVPRELHVSYTEVGLKLAYDTELFVSPFVEGYISNDYFFGAGRSLFLNGGPDFKLPWDVQGSLHVGHLFIEDKRKYIYPPYNVWVASLSKDLFDVNFAVQYSAMTVKFSQCLEQSVCGNKWIFRVSKTF